MKLIFTTPNMSEAAEAKTLLEQKGIPVFLSNKYQYSIIRKGFPNLVGVWVYQNHQETDARKVLANPDHMPKHPTNIDQFYELLGDKSVDFKTRNTILKWLIMLLIVAIPIAALIAYILMRS